MDVAGPNITLVFPERTPTPHKAQLQHDMQQNSQALLVELGPYMNQFSSVRCSLCLLG